MIKLVVLDIAGTTIEENGLVYEALNDVLTEKFGNRMNKRLLDLTLGSDKREGIIRVAESLGYYISDEELESTYKNFRSNLLHKYSVNKPIIMPGVEQAFKELRNMNIKIALSTGFSKDVAESVLEYAGVTVSEKGMVDYLITASDVSSGRPAPDMIFAAMKKSGVEKAHNVAVAGDTGNDILAGLAADARIVLGCTTGALSEEDFDPKPTHIGSVKDLPYIITSFT